MVGVNHYKNDVRYYDTESFSTPEDVLEFFIKHNDKEVYPFYDDRVTEYNIDIKPKNGNSFFL